MEFRVNGNRVNGGESVFIKLFFILYPIMMKLGEVVVPMCATTSPSFIKIGLEIKKNY